mmetsp:Transcript_5460/g.9225  ORF Transcript_5460/g.9225 Transcript_5460/m.9225 type:complete len:263 (+) Transcript_5460:1041-1829(+)
MLQIIQQGKFARYLPTNQSLTQFQPVDNTLRHINLDTILPSRLQQFRNLPLQLCLQLLHILTGNALPITLMNRTAPLQPPLHRCPRPTNKINHHQHKPLMQMILPRSQLHPILKYNPIQRPVLCRIRITQHIRSTSNTLQSVKNIPIHLLTSHCRTSTRRIRHGRCNIRFIFTNQRHGDSHSNHHNEDQTTSHHQGPSIHQIPKTTSLQFFVGSGNFTQTIIPTPRCGSAIHKHLLSQGRFILGIIKIRHVTCPHIRCTSLL